MPAFNGIDMTTGHSIEGPQSEEDLAAIVRGTERTVDEKAQVEDLRKRVDKAKGSHLAPVERVKDPNDLAQAGWGVIFSFDENEDVIRELQPLLELRKRQAGGTYEEGGLYREFSGGKGFKRGATTASTFLQAADGYGPVDPKKGIPYYLLIVGGPDKIPFRFQYQLDIQYAVGRIAFEDVADYGRYARAVVEAEAADFQLPKRAAFFGVWNEGDTISKGSALGLVQPLAKTTKKIDPEWEIDCPPPEETTRAKLMKLVQHAPALVLTASHGASLPKGHALQRSYAGALLCRDFSGVNAEHAPVKKEMFFAAADVPEGARLKGSIFMIFACYGAGVPREEDFFADGKTKKAIADKPFISALPQKLLANGAGAVIGHVERAWSTSFEGTRSKNQLQTFESTWQRLMEGDRVGYAMEYFNSKYAEMAALLNDAIQTDVGTEEAFKEANTLELANLWQAQNDARNYCVLGDPAVRVRVATAKKGGGATPAEPGSENTAAVPDAIHETAPANVPVAFSQLTGLNLNDRGLGSSSAQDSEGVLEGILSRVSATMGKIVDGLTTVEVQTYVSGDLSQVKLQDGKLEGVPLRAYTRLGMDGKTLNLVPEDDGKLDEALWKLHMQSVERAVANRGEMLKLAVDAASSLLGILKK